MRCPHLCVFCAAGAIIGAILGVLAGLTLLVGIAACIVCCRRKRLKASAPGKASPANAFVDARKQQQHNNKPEWIQKLPGLGPKPPTAPVYAPRGGSPPHKGGPYGGPPGGPPHAGPRPQSFNNRPPPGGSFNGYPPVSMGNGNGSMNGRAGAPPYGAAAMGAAALGAGAVAVGAGAAGRGVRDMRMSPGGHPAGAEEGLQDALKDLKYIVGNRLLPAVDNASLSVGACTRGAGAAAVGRFKWGDSA